MFDTRFFSDQETWTRLNSGSDNRNMKNVVPRFKIQSKIFHIPFFRSDKFESSYRIKFYQHYSNVRGEFNSNFRSPFFRSDRLGLDQACVG